MFLIAWHLAAKILIAFNKGNNGQWRFCHTHTHTHTHTQILEEIQKCKKELEETLGSIQFHTLCTGGKQSTSEEKRFFSDQVADKCIRNKPNPCPLSLSSSFYFH